jgi:hypothetical protein
MLRVNEVITAEEISIVFDDRDIPAGLPKDTECVLLPEGSSGRLLKYLNLDPIDILALPLVKNGAEKMSPGISRHSAVTNTLSVWQWFDQGQKANVRGIDLLEEPVNLGGMQDVLCMDHAK